MLTLYSSTSEYRKDSRLALFDSSTDGRIVAEIHVLFSVISSKKEDNILGLQCEKLKEDSVWAYKYTFSCKKELLSLQLSMFFVNKCEEICIALGTETVCL